MILAVCCHSEMGVVPREIDTHETKFQCSWRLPVQALLAVWELFRRKLSGIHERHKNTNNRGNCNKAERGFDTASYAPRFWTKSSNGAKKQASKCFWIYMPWRAMQMVLMMAGCQATWYYPIKWIATFSHIRGSQMHARFRWPLHNKTPSAFPDSCSSIPSALLCSCLTFGRVCWIELERGRRYL